MVLKDEQQQLYMLVVRTPNADSVREVEHRFASYRLNTVSDSQPFHILFNRNGNEVVAKVFLLSCQPV